MPNSEPRHVPSAAGYGFAPIEQITHTGTLYGDGPQSLSTAPTTVGPISLWLYLADSAPRSPGYMPSTSAWTIPISPR